jgi:hypothetical protein
MGIPFVDGVSIIVVNAYGIDMRHMRNFQLLQHDHTSETILQVQMGQTYLHSISCIQL